MQLGTIVNCERFAIGTEASASSCHRLDHGTLEHWSLDLKAPVSHETNISFDPLSLALLGSRFQRTNESLEHRDQANWEPVRLVAKGSWHR